MFQDYIPETLYHGLHAIAVCACDGGGLKSRKSREHNVTKPASTTYIITIVLHNGRGMTHYLIWLMISDIEVITQWYGEATSLARSSTGHQAN
jgi:hypothetical protein